MLRLGIAYTKIVWLKVSKYFPNTDYDLALKNSSSKLFPKLAYPSKY